MTLQEASLDFSFDSKGFTGFNEAGYGVGIGGGLGVCFYTLLDSEVIGECDCK